MINTVKQNLPFYQSIININDSVHAESAKKGTIILINGNAKTPAIRALCQINEGALVDLNVKSTNNIIGEQNEVKMCESVTSCEKEGNFHSKASSVDSENDFLNPKMREFYEKSKENQLSFTSQAPDNKTRQIFAQSIEEKLNYAQQRLITKYMDFHRIPFEEQLPPYQFHRGFNGYVNSSYMQGLESEYIPYQNMEMNPYFPRFCYPSCMCPDCHRYNNAFKPAPFYLRDPMKPQASSSFNVGNSQIEGYYNYF